MYYSNSRIFTFLTVLSVLAFTVSCATIFKGSDAEIQVNSAPSDATIMINGIDRGQTPQTLQLSRDTDHILTFKKDGYEPVKIEIEKKFDAGTTIVGNIFSWALVGIVVDVATGAAYSLNPHDLQANLEKMQAMGIIDEVPEQKEGEITVLMVTKKEWERAKSLR